MRKAILVFGICLLVLPMVAQAQGILFVKANKVGVGGVFSGEDPSRLLTLKADDAQQRIENTSATTAARTLVEMVNNGGVLARYDDTSTTTKWDFRNVATRFEINRVGSPGPIDFKFDVDGDLTTRGNVIELSSREFKDNFSAVDTRAVLDKLADLEIAEWTYKWNDVRRHIGPVAEDFHAAFGLNGNNDKHIALKDVGGVALAAIQGLNELISEKDARIDALEEQLAELQRMVSALAAK